MIGKFSIVITVIFVILFGVWYCINFDKLNAENVNITENTEDLVKNSIDKSENLEENINVTININTASYDELVSLPDIGNKTANKIIDYRKEHKGFKSVDEILKVDGIGQKTYDNIKKYLTI